MPNRPITVVREPHVPTDDEVVDSFIASWNRNYGGRGGEMTHERCERVQPACDHSNLSQFIDPALGEIRYCPACGERLDETPGRRAQAWDEYLDALEAHEEASH